MANKKRMIYAEDVIDALRDDPNITGKQYAMMKRHIEEVATVETEEMVWIPATADNLPPNFVSVLGYMPDETPFPTVRECYTVGNVFYFPALQDIRPVSHWCEMPTRKKEV